MKITFLGAAHEVTGSMTLLTVSGKPFLVDCGMEQGEDIFVNQELPVSGADVELVVLTHAHIDHAGNLPLLYKRGFRGPVYCTQETKNLSGIMLLDSAHIQESDAAWRSKRALRAGKKEVEPLYTVKDAQGVLENFCGLPYGEWKEILPGVRLRLNDMGHLLGSASAELELTEGGETRLIVFSGDVGNTHQPILRDPDPVAAADYVVVESTYGDRLHDAPPDVVPLLASYIQEALDGGGNLVIPSFAVGRTQEILYFIREIKERGLVKGHDGFPVYVDSPLAIEATNIFMNCSDECLDEEARALVRRGVNPVSFEGLITTVSAEESKAINFDKTPKVILSASGMCEAGRIRHHLKHNLWREECTVLFAGYQAVGTLGRKLMDGVERVELFDEEIGVRARIRTLPGISGHADKNGLLRWMRGFEKPPKLVFVNHGEDKVTDSFAKAVGETLGLDAVAPYSGAVFDLLTGEELVEAVGVPIKGAKSRREGGGIGGKQKPRADQSLDRLIGACERLLGLARKAGRFSAKAVAKFTDQVNSLADKWE